MEDKDRLALCLRMNPNTWLVSAMRERDSAVLEKNSAVAEKRSALADRDNAFMQRNVAYAERDNAILDRDRALAALDMARSEGQACAHCTWNRRFCTGSRFSQPISLINTGKFSDVVPLLQSAEFSTTGLDSEEDKKSKKGRKSKKLKGDGSEDCMKDHAEAKKSSTIKNVPKVSKSAFKKSPKPREEVSRVSSQSGSQKTFNDEKNVNVNGNAYFALAIPSPYCSCTGTNEQCYRWGRSGWQSSCCTNMISMHPLPMNPKKRGCRVAGRKMSAGAFGRLLERLVSEGWDANIPVDLKDYWSKHGTNSFKIIK